MPAATCERYGPGFTPDREPAWRGRPKSLAPVMPGGGPSPGQVAPAWRTNLRPNHRVFAHPDLGTSLTGDQLPGHPRLRGHPDGGGSRCATAFRFRYGESDAQTLAIVHGLGYGGIRWTVDTRGWKGLGGPVHRLRCQPRTGRPAARRDRADARPRRRRCPRSRRRRAAVGDHRAPRSAATHSQQSATSSDRGREPPPPASRGTPPTPRSDSAGESLADVSAPPRP
jgi:hypothetical protein